MADAVSLRDKILAEVNASGIHDVTLRRRLADQPPLALDMALRCMLRDGVLEYGEPEVYYRPVTAGETKSKRPRHRKIALSPTTQKRGATGGAITECVMCGQFKRKAAEEVCGECRAEMDAIFNRGAMA